MQIGSGKKASELESTKAKVLGTDTLTQERKCDKMAIYKARNRISRNLLIRAAVFDAI